MVTFRMSDLSLVLAILYGFLQGAVRGQTLIGPNSVVVKEGTDTTLTCRVLNNHDGTTKTFVWSDTTWGLTPVTIFMGGTNVVTNESPKYKDFSVEEDESSSVLTISETEVFQEGTYRCDIIEIQDTASPAQVTVEVMSKLDLILDSESLVVGTQYTATCSAVEGRPLESIEWYLGGKLQYQGIVEYTNPTGENQGLSDMFSMFTFTPVKENNGQSLECRTTGHQLTSLNQDTNITSLNVVFPPDDSIIIVNFIEDGTDLKTTCHILPGQQPNPEIEALWIYKNYSADPYQTPMASPLIEPAPDHITKYTCAGENPLGNTSTAKLFIPCLFPSESVHCSNSGLVAGISILAILLAGSLSINVALYLKITRQSASKENNSFQMDRRFNNSNGLTVDERVRQADQAYQTLEPNSLAVSAENLIVSSKIVGVGNGDFGEVWKGELTTKQKRTAVAVRQLKDQAETFTRAVQLVKYLGHLPEHQNIVRYLGYCCENSLVTGSIISEYIPGGTLLALLQSGDRQVKSDSGNLQTPKPGLDESQLIKYAWQVAKGMEFLASHKIIQGNLCANDILMKDSTLCKISDYGMTLAKMNKGNKPTRWTSPQVMLNGQPSLEGDVWSYGVLLWEIVTLGGKPYPTMTMEEVKKQVTNGYTMPCPKHCGQELYAVMTMCWVMELKKRCDFHQIMRKIELVMEKDHEYLSLQDLEEGLYEYPDNVI